MKIADGSTKEKNVAEMIEELNGSVVMEQPKAETEYPADHSSTWNSLLQDAEGSSFNVFWLIPILAVIIIFMVFVGRGK